MTFSANQLRPAGQLAHNFGAKIILYGPPGTSKTPQCNYLPNPVMMVAEPGLMSMRASTIAAAICDTPAKVRDFMDWTRKSAEFKRFDTLAIDSMSEIAEIVLKDAEDKNAHGLKAYGDMAEEVYNWIRDMFYMPQKHVMLICKEDVVTTAGGVRRRPYFPGKELNVKVPHLFDEIWRIGVENVPGMGQTRAIRTADSFDSSARDRSGKLLELEEPNVGKLIAKLMA